MTDDQADAGLRALRAAIRERYPRGGGQPQGAISVFIARCVAYEQATGRKPLALPVTHLEADAIAADALGGTYRAGVRYRTFATCNGVGLDIRKDFA